MLLASLKAVGRSVLVSYLVIALAAPAGFAAGGSGGGGSGAPAMGLPSSASTLPMDFGASAAGADGGMGSASGAFAADLMASGTSEGALYGDISGGAGRGTTYFAGYYRGAVMIPIYLAGAVQRPGLYYVPTRTSLLKLITLAGGASRDAELDDIVIKRVEGDIDSLNRENLQEKTIEVDALKLMRKAGSRGPLLAQNDFVTVPFREPIIGNNTLTVVGLVASMLGIVVSGALISKQLEK